MAKITKYMENYISSKVEEKAKDYKNEMVKDYWDRTEKAKLELIQIINNCRDDVNKVMDKYNFDRTNDRPFPYLQIENKSEYNNVRRKEKEFSSKLHALKIKVIALASLEKSLTIEKIDTLIDGLDFAKELEV